MSGAASRRENGAGAHRISLAILAMGGQGGGVLADWIVALAEAQGWAAQSTSVPGVAQRTGATIYYIEMAPIRRAAPQPVFALMPTPGDVDVVMASELMEAGRSVLRGLVTPEQTTLIASTHRAFAVVEKQTPGDGVGDPAVVSVATEFAAKRVIAFDMEAMAKAKGSVISAAMFGALAATKPCRLSAQRLKAAIRAGGTGVEASLRAFAAAFNQARQIRSSRSAVSRRSASRRCRRRQATPSLIAVARIRRAFAEGATDADRRSAPTGRLSRSRLRARISRSRRPLLDHDRAHGGERRGFAFTVAAAKYVAVAMAYDDVPRVADLKIRASRQARVRLEVAAAADTIVTTTEYFHPRVEELCGVLPKRWGEWIEGRPSLFKALDRVVNRGRRIRTNTVTGYLMLAAVASLGAAAAARCATRAKRRIARPG